TPDNQLPFIPASEVTSKAASTHLGAELWIVIDNIVYDCSGFVHEHPGGESIIRNFQGQNCSWQFWRFHGRKELAEFGVGIRVGRTEGIGNRFREPIRY
ncbi:cytochrome b5, partial [Glonium stellatum]